MFIQLTILCNKEEKTSEDQLTPEQREALALPSIIKKDEDYEWRISRVNINHISAYYLSSNKKETILHISGMSLSTKETPEEIDNLIKQLTNPTNGNTLSYTAVVS